MSTSRPHGETMEMTKQKPTARVVKMPTRSKPSATAEQAGMGSSGYYDHILSYAHRIRETRDASEIIRILDEALQETRSLHTLNELAVAQRQVADAERKISTLKAE